MEEVITQMALYYGSDYIAQSCNYLVTNGKVQYLLNAP